MRFKRTYKISCPLNQCHFFSMALLGDTIIIHKIVSDSDTRYSLINTVNPRYNGPRYNVFHIQRGPCYMPCPFHPPGLDHEAPHYAVFSILPSLHLSSIQIFFSNTLSLCSTFNVRDQVAHPYRTTDKIIVLYILFFMFLDSRREYKGFWTEW
jgi:hypothetical protein